MGVYFVLLHWWTQSAGNNLLLGGRSTADDTGRDHCDAQSFRAKSDPAEPGEIWADRSFSVGTEQSELLRVEERGDENGDVFVERTRIRSACGTSTQVYSRLREHDEGQ